MGDQAIIQKLKQVPGLVSSKWETSRKEALDIISEAVMVEPALPAGAIKGLCRITVALSGQFKERRMQYRQRVTLSQMAKSPLYSPHLATSFLSLAEDLKESGCSSVPACSSNLPILQACSESWLGYLQSPDAQEEVSVAFVEASAILFSLVVSSGKPSLNRKALNLFTKIWGYDAAAAGAFNKVLKKQEIDIHMVMYGGYFLDSMKANKSSLIDEVKQKLTQTYVKLIFQTKVKPTSFTLECGRPLLKQISHEELSNQVLPTVYKSLLRSPEAVLTSVACLARDVQLDLGPYLKDFSKYIQAPLHHKEDNIRSDAVTACAMIAQRSSDIKAVTDFVSSIFDVYFGADGKLTVTTHKVSVLQAVERIYSPTSSERTVPPSLLESFLSKWQRLVEAESHEGTLLQAMSAQQAWFASAGDLSTPVVKNILENFQKNLGLKAWLPSVKAAYFRNISFVIKSCSASQIAPLIIKPTLKCLEKALTQHTQIAFLVEAISAVNLLLTLSSKDSTLDSELSSLWNSALDMKKAYFTSEKFLITAPYEAMTELSSVASLLLKHQSIRFADHQDTLLKSLVLCLSWRKSDVTSPSTMPADCYLPTIRGKSDFSDSKHNVCESSRDLTDGVVRFIARTMMARNVTASEGGRQMALKVLNAFSDYLDCSVIENTDSEHFTSPIVCSPAGIQQALISLFCVFSDADVKFKHQLALTAVTVCCSPYLTRERLHLWPMLCQLIGVQPSDVIKSQKDIAISLLTTNYKPSLTNSKVVSELCRYCGNILYPQVMEFVVDNLDIPELLEISEEEYAIFQTGEGKLYHQHLVDDAFELNLDTKHVKKTSKVYSHKEQVMMLEEKKAEIERKRKAGTLELTQKQREIQKIQQEKENATKKKVGDIVGPVPHNMSLLTACIEGDTEGSLALHITKMVPLLMKYVTSPPVTEQYISLFMKIRQCVIPKEHSAFGDLVSRTTIRAQGVDSRFLPVDWQGESTSEAALRAVTHMYKITVPEVVEMDEEDEDQFFTAPAFVYCFPLLQWVLTHIGEVAHEAQAMETNKDEGEGGSDDESDDEGGELSKEKESDRIACLALQIISEHACMRGSVSPDETDLYHPRLLPLQLLLSLVIRVIGVSGGRTHAMACSVLCEVCGCGSGGPGCHRVTREEIRTLLDTLVAPSCNVRDAGLRGLEVLSTCLPVRGDNADDWLHVCHRLWVSKHDENAEVQELANNLWEKMGMEVDDSITKPLMNDLTYHVGAVRFAAASALAALLAERKELVKNTISALITLYKEKTTMTPAKRDKYDRITQDAIDHWEGRSGVAIALRQIAPLVEQDQVVQLVKFFVPEALGDRNSKVANNMLAAATALINYHGKDTVNHLLPIFEKCLKSAPNHASFDTVRQSVIILMGSLAKHLDPTNPKIKAIAAKLVEALSTPSQAVQEAVASCLHPLVPSIKDDCPKLISKLMKILLESDKYGERKGAAYGLASLVKGMGILALKQHDIITKLTTSIQDKKNYKYREGALFGLEQLCSMLGKMFEPYIVHILPHLLACFGDSNARVRQAAKDTARAVMSKLSAHGVKLVLPSLLTALEEDSWMTKKGSIELLGNMAYCAPKQLSSCLPSVVPRLIEVLSDSHHKVRAAGVQALRLIGSVIKNPEIQAIVKVLLAALQDPGRNTSRCLQVLLHTKFIHFIDAPSLALIMPVVEKAFEDRSTETRKMSAQIIGNMYSLTDQKDLTPYLPAIIPGLKASLLDPVPKVRSVSARALGAMVKGMGESSFEDLLPWLMQTLTAENSPVDRSGAAQGLSEVVGGLGVEKLNRLMPDIVATAERSDIAPHVKDGYIMMFIYLPTVFQDDFIPYIGQIIPPILNALADETEYVRDTALKAGKRIVSLYATTSISLLLPELESGLFHDNWRIRFSSIQLLGDLLYCISGVSGKMTTDTANEDDNFGTEHSQHAIIDALGSEKRNRVLAGLYICRSDIALLVRQSALHVWKVVVTNTPKTLKEILPTLFTILLGCLASTSYDKRHVAARTLGELVRKLGERVLPEIIPILEAGLLSEEADHRQGVCIGLSEIMASTSRDMVLCFTDNLVPTVRRALCDPLPSVREAAAQTFDSLHLTIGQKALDETLPPLLSMLKADQKINQTEEEKAQSEYALDGLKQVMAIKSRVVLPYLVPQLTAPPINTEALSILASVAGDSLTKHLDKILPALTSALNQSWGTEATPSADYEIVLSHCQGVVLSVTDPAGVNIIIDELLRFTKKQDIGQVRASVALLVAFCSNTKADYSDYISPLLRGLLQLFTSNDKPTLQAAWSALNAVIKSVDVSEQKSLVHDVRQSVKFASSDLKPGQLMPGFCLPKGIMAILPIYREAILNGEAEMKEVGAIALAEVIRLTSSDSLKLSVIHVTGPLIRILGDRFTPSVKVAVLDTIGLLLEKTGALLKPFLPQLQTTFLKAIHDPTRAVRLRSGSALSYLVAIHMKPDPIFVELQNSLKSEEDATIRETLIFCVRKVFCEAGKRVPEAVRKDIMASLIHYMSDEHDGTRQVAAGAIASILPWMTETELKSTISSVIMSNDSSPLVRHGQLCAIFSAIKQCPETFFSVVSDKQVIATLIGSFSIDDVLVLQAIAITIGYYNIYKLKNKDTIPQELVVPFCKLINNTNNDVKQSMCRSCQYVSESEVLRGEAQLPLATAKAIIPALINGTKEKNQVVKSSAEMALVALLKMKEGDSGCQKMVSSLEGSMKDNLMECISRSLRKSVYYPVTEVEMDITTLS